jgi:signal transduction histidine kinase
VAYYTNLPPGAYTFRVKAANKDGVWNDQGATVRFRLKPDFYETIWFYALCVLLLALIVIAAYRFRIRRMRLQFAAVLEERNRISREIHDTLTQDFTAIVLQLEAAEMVMENVSEDAKSFVDRARELARNGLTESRRFVQALRPVSLEAGNLSQALAQMAERTFDGSSLQHSIEVTGQERRLPPGVEDNLLRIAQEACTNIRKHAHARRAKISLHFRRLLTEMKIEDDGRGFDPENPAPSGHGGFGLTSMRERAAQSKGRMQIRSIPGHGTTIVVTVSKW